MTGNGTRARIIKLEERAGLRKAPPIVVVFEEADGTWTEPTTGRVVRREDYPPDAKIIVFGERPDGPQ